MNNHTTSKSHSTLTWSDGLPYSERFGDIYFSVDSGLEESRHVFLQHNHLAQRWACLPPRGQFVIGETGFGTGLNFLAAAELWLKTAPAEAQLYYLSVEKYPLNRDELSASLALWPSLKPLSDPLIAAYPEQPETEIYPLVLADGRIHLLLTIEDACAGLQQQLHLQHQDFITPKTQVDAWFLDGFAPSKNADMWSDELFATLAQLSHSNTTFATFTSAGSVRRGLQAAGFQVRKQKGFGRKREMLNGEFAGAPVNALNLVAKNTTPWQAYGAKPEAKHALIIGAGISGCHTANVLAKSGWKVTLIEAMPAPAQKASGNNQGIVYAKLSPKRHPQGRFNIASLSFAQTAYREFWQAKPQFGQACGVLQLAEKEEALDQQQASAATLPTSLAELVDAMEASALAGYQLPHGGLHLPNTGWLNPPALCQWLLDQDNITTVFNTQIQQLTPLPNNRWQATGSSEDQPSYSISADLVVVCSAEQAKQFDQLQHLPLKSIRGQVTHLPETATSSALTKVITQEGYLAPSFEGHHCLGATFNLKVTDPSLNDDDHLENLRFLENLPTFYGEALPLPEHLSGRVGFRCTSPDYLPLVGPVAKEVEMAEAYKLLSKNAKRVISSAYHYWPNLLVNLAHGSRGLAYTPLCAHYIAALANSSPNPIRQDLCQALNPARFIIRDIARGKR